jgi:thiamine biosynthesis lipoprotein
VETVIEEFDRACSRFRDDSELTALNAAAGRPLRTSWLLIEAVEAALRAASLTEGDVDPSLGEALIALGYDRDLASVGRESASGPGDRGWPQTPLRPAPKIAKVPGWRAIRVDRSTRTIQLPHGVSLDLGATAKALAVDRAAIRASQGADCGVLVGLGGDIALAGPAPDDGWRVRVTDDHRAGVEVPGQWITLRSGGLATSSTTVRRWRAGNELVHHLLDPASGRPVTGTWRTASVTASSCLDANIASTAAIVRGQRAVPWLESLRLPSRLVSGSGATVHLVGWPADGDDLPTSESGLAA